MVIAGIIAVRRVIQSQNARLYARLALRYGWLPQYFPDYFNYGGCIKWYFYPTEASAIAVIYTLFLALVLYLKSQLKIYLKYFWNPLLPLQCLVINWFFDGNVMGNVKR